MNWKRFFVATFILYLGALLAGLIHFAAHYFQDMRLTIMGYGLAVGTGIYYGVQNGYDIRDTS